MSAANQDDQLLAAVKADNVEKLAELLDGAGAVPARRLELLQAAAEASSARAARLLLEDELERHSESPAGLRESLSALLGRFPRLADWALMAAAAAGQFDCLEQLLLAELPEPAESESLWRRLSVCLADRHPQRLLHAAASGRCPRLLSRLRPEAIDSAMSDDEEELTAAERAAAESVVAELLPVRIQRQLLSAQVEPASLAKAAVATGSAELVRRLLSLGRLRPEHLESPSVQSPADLVLAGHLELAKELLLLRRRHLLHCCLDLRRACADQLKRLPPASSPLLSASPSKSKSKYSASAASTTSPESLRQLASLAEQVCLNALDAIYAECPPACQPLVHRQLLQPPPSGTGASIADKSPRSLFATRCFVDLIDRRWRAGVYPREAGRCWRSLASLATPREKFLMHTTAFLIFMAFHAYYIVSLQTGWAWQDWLMSAYLISYSLQELHELVRTLRRYFNIWNLIDQLQLLFLLLGQAFKAAVVTQRAGTELIYEARVLLGVSFMLCGLKFVLQLRAYRKFGPFINMMKALFWSDLLPFLAAMFLFLVVCSGIFFHALLTPGNQVYTASGSLLRGNQTQLYLDIYLRPLLLAFGELRYDNLANCLDGEDASLVCPHPAGLRAYAGGLMHVYLIVVNLLLINLLIAKFSLTVSVKDASGFLIWRRYRYHLLREFEAINVLPAPINAPNILFDLSVLRWRRLKNAVNNCRSEDEPAAADNDPAGVELRTAVLKPGAAEIRAADADGCGAAGAVFELIQAVALRRNRREILSRERGASSSYFDG